MNSQPFDAVAVSTSLLPTGKTPPPVTRPPTLVFTPTVIVAAGAKNAVLVLSCAGTVMVCSALVLPSFQTVKSQLFDAVAVKVALLPTKNTPPPATLPPLAGLANTVTVLAAA